MKTTIFKTIHLGGAKPELKDVHVSDWAKDMLDKVSYQKKKEPCDLVCLTPGELGFNKPPTTTELYAAAKEQGYDLCPAEVGPRLREVYTDQPLGEWLYVAMEPIPDSGGGPSVFGVGRSDGGGSWLDVAWAGPARRWDLCKVVGHKWAKSLKAGGRPNSVCMRCLRFF